MRGAASLMLRTDRLQHFPARNAHRPFFDQLGSLDLDFSRR